VKKEGQKKTNWTKVGRPRRKPVTDCSESERALSTNQEKEKKRRI